jgi:hypothetical protein
MLEDLDWIPWTAERTEQTEQNVQINPNED